MGQPEHIRRTQRLSFRTMRTIPIKRLSRKKPPINRNHIPGAYREEVCGAFRTCGRQTFSNGEASSELLVIHPDQRRSLKEA
jgi:hypothetical protein